MDFIVRYHDNPEVKMLVLLGEVGGTEEYKIVQAIKEGRLTKPIVAWCIGTCASMFTSEVQFGHAGSCANSDSETAVAKNEALKMAGAHVPATFDSLGDVIHDVYTSLVDSGVIVPRPEVAPPTVPMDFNWARVSMQLFTVSVNKMLILYLTIRVHLILFFFTITGIGINS